MIISIDLKREAMPRLNRHQREQAIGRCHAGQVARVIANAFNCSTRTIERLRQSYNATNSTNDRPRSSRPQVTTQRQNRYNYSASIWTIDLQEHRKQHDIPTEHISDPSVMIQYVVGWDLTTSDVVVPTEVLSLHKTVFDTSPMDHTPAKLAKSTMPEY